MRGRMFAGVALAALAILCICTAPTLAATQMFPVKKDSKGVSAYLIKPTEGMAELPAGWQKITSLSYGNSSLAEECLTPAAKDAVCTTTSYSLPKSEYTVSVLMRGEGKARLKGAADWTAMKSAADNTYTWIEIGAVNEATEVVVEIASSGARTFFYAGLLAEGQVMPVIPVAGVLQRIKAGGPATVVLLGDSVTENSGGTGGGASSFEKGNPGLMLALLRDLSGGEVGHLSHREPPAWKGVSRKEEPGKLPVVEVDGKTVYDARQQLDGSKKVHLVNLGKGGAASDWGWSRLAGTIVEYDYFDTILDKADRKDTIRYGMGHYKPDLVFINFGTNDVNGVHGKWTVEDYMFHMKVLATNIQHRFGAAVILSAPHKWTTSVHLYPHLQPRMVLALRQYCRTTGLAMADVYNEYGAEESDQIHPRDAGHKHIADAYAKALLGQPSEPLTKARITAADLKDNGDGTITDTKSGLMWMKQAGATAEPVAANTVAEAVAEANATKRLGYDNWRLPTRSELLGLVDPMQSNPALPQGHPFVGVKDWYQSSDGSWGVDLPSGVAYMGKGAERPVNVWLVRDAAK